MGEKEQKPFWSNCLIQAMKHHWRDPDNVDFILIHGGPRLHVMWLDRREGKIKHFTHRKLTGKFSTLWFKGTIENVEYGALKEWCEKNKVKFKMDIKQFEVKYTVDGKERTAIVLCDSKPEARKIVQGNGPNEVEFTSIKEMAK